MANIKVTPAFSSSHVLTTLLTFLLIVCVLIDLITIALGYSQLMFLSSVLSGDKVLSYKDVKADYEGQQFVRTVLIAAYLASGVVFVIWVYRARRNLLAVGSRGQRYSSPWAVPLLNLWRQSNPDVGLSDAFFKQHGSTVKEYSSKTVLIGLSWGFVIASLVVARISGTFASHATDISDLINESWIDMISHALRIVGIIILIVLVIRIDARIKEKHKRHTLDTATQQLARS